jgi:hypothetical protein
VTKIAAGFRARASQSALLARSTSPDSSIAALVAATATGAIPSRVIEVIFGSSSTPSLVHQGGVNATEHRTGRLHACCSRAASRQQSRSGFTVQRNARRGRVLSLRERARRHPRAASHTAAGLSRAAARREAAARLRRQRITSGPHVRGRPTCSPARRTTAPEEVTTSAGFKDDGRIADQDNDTASGDAGLLDCGGGAQVSRTARMPHL